MAQAVILAGGRGDRFWPLTSDRFPKYRMRLAGRDSILQLTHRRLSAVFGRPSIWVVTTRSHVRHVRAELPYLPLSRILVEPDRRNTAAAVYLSMRLLRERFGPSETVAFFPADHLIERRDLFESTVKRALRAARTRPALVTIGIRPTRPATGYGYIRRGRPVAGAPGCHEVLRFVEKPDERTAARYLRTGSFYWNAGMFAWTTETFFRYADRICPEYGRLFDPKRLSASYRRLPRLPIDRALMEGAAAARGVVVISTRMDWCDMGSWDAYYARAPKDGAGNRLEGAVVAEGLKGCLVYNSTREPLVLSDQEDRIVVKTRQGTLVCPRGVSEESARLAERLERR